MLILTLPTVGKLIAVCSTYSRIVSLVNQWSKEVKLEPTTGLELELTLDTSPARQALHDLQFVELKGQFIVRYILMHNLLRCCKKKKNTRKNTCVTFLQTKEPDQQVAITFE